MHLSPCGGSRRGLNIMKVTLKDPNQSLHGKLHKRDPYYFRHHYGEQRLVYISKPYIDRPTEKQKASRKAFTILRKEVARQLHDPALKARWEARFKKDPQGYKMLHTYVYAKLKAGESVAPRLQTQKQQPLLCLTPNTITAPSQEMQSNIAILVVNGMVIPIFLPAHIPKRYLANVTKKPYLCKLIYES